MIIAVYETGHEIADTVADALMHGLPNSILIEAKTPLPFADVHVAYGILRGTADIFKQSEHWFNIDRGYFNPGHYEGYYQISYKGTQAKYDPSFPITKEFDGKMEPIRKYDNSKPILVCPPTDAVCKFFGLKWWNPGAIDQKFVVRQKGEPNPINWDDYSAVITFNSSVGWQALQRGIPCFSDPLHSVVGSYYNTKSIDEAIEMFNSMPREPLFNFMRSHQFTLAEIEQGHAWPLIKWYTSDGMRERQLPPKYAPTVSAEGLKNLFQSNT